MSKESKPRDLWNHALGRRDLTGFCVGCGYYYAVHRRHRADCTATDKTTTEERTP